MHEPNKKLAAHVDTLSNHKPAYLMYNEWGTQAFLITQDGETILVDSDQGVCKHIVIDPKFTFDPRKLNIP